MLRKTNKLLQTLIKTGYILIIIKKQQKLNKYIYLHIVNNIYSI